MIRCVLCKKEHCAKKRRHCVLRKIISILLKGEKIVFYVRKSIVLRRKHCVLRKKEHCIKERKHCVLRKIISIVY